MAQRLLAIAMTLALAGSCWGQEQQGTDPNVAVPLVMSVLSKAHVSGSLVFSGHCDQEGVGDFPKIHASSNAEGPLQTLREMFSDDPKMQITQEPDGTIRMIETDVPTDLLNLRIGHLSFKRDEGRLVSMYNPNEALWAILRAPEIVDFMRLHDIEWPFQGARGVSWAHGLLSAESPHISGDLDNVTLFQALARLQQSFPGLWLYKNCPGREPAKRLVAFAFYTDSPGWAALEEADRNEKKR
jgi:hypothetical protein